MTIQPGAETRGGALRREAAVLRIRRAIPTDALDLLEWRNDPVSRGQSRDDRLICETDHLRWFAKVLIDDSRLLMIGEVGAQKVGMVRLDYESDSEVSINVNPRLRGRGYGQALLQAVLSSQTGPFVAYIKEGNLPSMRLFERVGFTLERAEAGFMRYVRTP